MKNQSDDSGRKNPELKTRPKSRREFLEGTGRLIVLAVMGGGLLRFFRRNADVTAWQLDPAKCIQCGRCATECVLTPSAVKCVHAYQACGYCRLCGGYHRPNAKNLDTAAENQLCPTGAIQRTFIEEPYYEYRIDEKLCNGCAKCVKGCTAFGNGSLYLQVRYDRCVGCNECRIAQHCPAGAFFRVPVKKANLPREATGGS